jgi:hypothetical protein
MIVAIEIRPPEIDPDVIYILVEHWSLRLLSTLIPLM